MVISSPLWAGTEYLGIYSSKVQSTCPFTGSNGCATAAHFNFRNDTDSGMFRVGWYQAGFAINGSNRVTITNTWTTSRSTTTFSAAIFLESETVTRLRDIVGWSPRIQDSAWNWATQTTSNGYSYRFVNIIWFMVRVSVSNKASMVSTNTIQMALPVSTNSSVIVTCNLSNCGNLTFPSRASQLKVRLTNSVIESVLIKSGAAVQQIIVATSQH